MHRRLYAGIFAWCIFASSHADVLVCPVTIKGVTQISELQGDWQLFLPQAQRAYPLVEARVVIKYDTITYGTFWSAEVPDNLAELERSDEAAVADGPRTERAIWDVRGPSDYWLECRYSETAVVLRMPLHGFRVCEKTVHNSRIVAMECRK